MINYDQGKPKKYRKFGHNVDWPNLVKPVKNRTNESTSDKLKISRFLIHPNDGIWYKASIGQNTKLTVQ